MEKIKVGILGYGNLGRGVELAVAQQEDMELVVVATRREPGVIETVYKNVEVINVKDLEKWKDVIDVLIICGGSARDLPVQTPNYAKNFNVIDAFDNHSKALEHFKRVRQVAIENRTTAIIGVGWDPGLFSLYRMFSEAVLVNGRTQTFWGKGVSQGHSDALRRVKGVKDAIQYTVPKKEILERVRAGEELILTNGEKHNRDCYVVPELGSDMVEIEKDILEMEDYFKGYETSVHFISEKALATEHGRMNHGGVVIRNGHSGFNNESEQKMEFQLTLDSNPEFTALVMVAYVRAVKKLAEVGNYGCYTVFDVPPAYIIEKSQERLISEML